MFHVLVVRVEILLPPGSIRFHIAYGAGYMVRDVIT
jgi:hypothetical protein